MNAGVLDHSWLSAWRDGLNAALESFLTTFASTYGYPPDNNQIVGAIGDASTADGQLGGHPAVPSAMADFYAVIEQVTLPDIGNGYFIHSARHMLDELMHDGPVHLGESIGVVFGSDGGGILFAISTDATIYRSHAASRDSGFEVIATDLRGFLDQLHQAVIRFIQTGQPGWL
jgi:hypothetical protein